VGLPKELDELLGLPKEMDELLGLLKELDELLGEAELDSLEPPDEGEDEPLEIVDVEPEGLEEDDPPPPPTLLEPPLGQGAGAQGAIPQGACGKHTAIGAIGGAYGGYGG
jgi:hypothetical protein